jgi:hypothetical protein
MDERACALLIEPHRRDAISGVVGFPDPWLFEQCELPAELT